MKDPHFEIHVTDTEPEGEEEPALEIAMAELSVKYPSLCKALVSHLRQRTARSAVSSVLAIKFTTEAGRTDSFDITKAEKIFDLVVGRQDDQPTTWP